MIEEILPPEVVAVDTREECLDVELFPEERVALGQAVEKRRREFTTARACARQALAQLGLPPSPIVNGERGEPRWPVGVVGAITHCAGYRGCALARAGQLAGVGIDAEPSAPLPEGVLGEIARAEERPLLRELARAEPAVHWDRLLFCAKETIYKVWFPIARCWLGFEDATLTIDPAARTFQARLLVPWPEAGAHFPALLEGRWLVRDGLTLAAIALTHPDDSRI
ncbi:MAG TPA: 4'-phosphopantetheinyl transferase superfamily protein [Solirubrobacteraceae bacterium]|nr:4'-phosphopantetheinyl transferase superfamily protein [Solirubrobacteraceae bacterium]